MTRSADEQELRNAVVVRLRELLPDARIIHELNIAGQGSNRIDVVAVTKEHIVGVEIKSRKDTLKRLEHQWESFNEVCHLVIVAAHDKHFKDWREQYWSDDQPSVRHIDHPLFYGNWKSRSRVWQFPKADPEQTPSFWRSTDGMRWFFDRHKALLSLPRATAMLGTLWAAELQAECSRHRISSTQRTTRDVMIRDLAWNLTGKEITQAVCRQLRQRTFAEADRPIYAEPPETAPQPVQIDLALPSGVTA